MSRTLIVGASVAGLAVARELRQAGDDGEVILVGDEDHLPYDRPPLSKQVLSGAWDEERVWMCDHDTLAAERIEFHAGARATRLDADLRKVELSTGEKLGYDDLVIATGGRPRVPASWASIDGVSSLRTLDHVRSLRSRLSDAKHVVVVGAGFIGAEAAAAVAVPERVVTLVDPLPLPMAGTLAPELAAILADVHRDHGVHLACGVAVSELVTANHRVSGVRLSDGSEIKADLVIVGLGTHPNIDWLEGSRVPTGDGVLCDEHCRAADRIYAAGDVASWLNPRFGVRMRVEHRLHAVEQAAYVARSIARGRTSGPFAPIPFFWSDQFDVRLQAYGHLQPDDQLDVIAGHLCERKLVATCTRDGRVVGVVGINMPRELRMSRALVDAACPAPDSLEPVAVGSDR